MPECEAERRNKQALHAMELDWGAGAFDYAKTRVILTCRNLDQCNQGAPLTTQVAFLQHHYFKSERP